MRILSLRMKNFAPLFYSLDKTEVNIDYTREDLKGKVIYIFIGKMGSCKTFLLGHHQPFATLGTLDARNSKDMILPGKRGIKEIVYQSGDDLFEIVHIYLPSKDNHSVKSYIKKNGNELNPNGNANSFRTIIATEFGLDQNYLKLFRIGANVINLPDMGPSERKSFVSNMLAETETYSLLYRRIGERNRLATSQMTMLLNRLRAISDQPEERLEAELKTETDILNDVNEQYAAALKESYRLEAELKTLLQNATLDDTKASLKKVEEDLTDTVAQRADLVAILESLKDIPDMQTLTEQIAALRATQELRQRQCMELGQRLDDLSAQQNSVRDKLAILGSEEHVQRLRETYTQLMGTIGDYEKKIEHFTYTGTMSSVDALLADLRTVDGMIADLTIYNVEALEEIFHNSKKACNHAQYEIRRLQKEHSQHHAELQHASQASTYVPTHTMTRPPLCPTADCPFFKYHPYTISRKKTGDQLDKAFLEHRNHIAAIEAKLDFYEAYPRIAERVSALQKVWNRIYPKVDELKAAHDYSLSEVVINPTKRQWYDRSKLDRIRELCGIRERYYELMQQVASMRNDLAVYDVSDRADLQRQMSELTSSIAETKETLEKQEFDYEEKGRTLTELEKLFEKLSQLQQYQMELSMTESRQKELDATRNDLLERIAKAEAHTAKLATLSATLTEKQTAYRTHEQTCNQLRRKLTDIAYTKQQFNDASLQQEILKDILNAVSSKNGIPLAFVQLFLVDCKDIINDLVSDVFDDHIEIQQFHIPENGTEFNIPYTKNGTLISDINEASQGERAIVSLALSFALIRQACFQYNIMLLDEMDGPLYREDRNKFIAILMKQLHAIRAEQVFLVSHNSTFDGYNVGVIMTTPEIVDESPLTAVIKI